MKKSITLYFVAFSYILFFNQSVTAQNFLWGRSGGSYEPTGGNDDETVKDMAVDRNGNVYILALVKTKGLNISGQPVTGYGSEDVMLASFNPKGSLRWVKMIGNGDDDRSYWLGIDAKDGVYFSANLRKDNNPSLIDKDATSPTNQQRNILVKYDTAGKFQWYRHPEMDTFTSTILTTKSRNVAMDVAPSGTVYWLLQLPPGGYGNGALTVPPGDTSIYLIKYSASGAFSYSKPDLKMAKTSISQTAMTIDEPNNRFYLSGSNSGEIWFNGTQLSPLCGYVGCFKLDGSFIWKKETNGTAFFYSRTALDGSGNIYLAGSGPSGLSFNGFTIATGSAHYGPFIIKMDKNGNLLWGKHANAAQGAIFAAAVAVRNSNEVILTGKFAKKLDWPGYTGTLTSSYYELFITRFQTWDGKVIGMDKIESADGFHEYPRHMAADGKGNVYIGGEFTERMFVNQKDTLYNTTGGTTDWFLVKYGDVWPMGVSTANSNSNVSIYPNPATEQVTMSGISSGTSIQVLNMLSQQVIHTLSKGETEVLDTRGIVPGSYILQLTRSDGGRENFRIVKR